MRKNLAETHEKTKPLMQIETHARTHRRAILIVNPLCV
jgi:hypothetical protein